MLFQVVVSGLSACCCGADRSAHAGFETATVATGLAATVLGAEAALGTVGAAGDWAKAKVGKMTKLKTTNACFISGNIDLKGFKNRRVVF